MNELRVFENPAFGQVRTIEADGEPWFVGKDVAEALGYESARAAVSKKVDVEDRGVSKMETPSGTQEMTIINESSLYSLILSSKLPTAKDFKRGVTFEVLPSIRKTGTYTNLQAVPADTNKQKRAEAMLINAKSRVAKQMQSLWDRAGVEAQYQALALNDYYDGLQVPKIALQTEATALYDATTIAKRIGVLSVSGKPHAQAVGAIIEKLDIAPEERTETPYCRNGHDGISVQHRIRGTESNCVARPEWAPRYNFQLRKGIQGQVCIVRGGKRNAG